MSFASIVTNTGTFNERSKGVYVGNNVVFGDPADELRLRPNTNPKVPTIAITRYKQTDYTAPGSTQTSRISANVVLNISVPATGFTLADIDVMVAEISEFVTAANLSRLMQGEA